MMVAKLAEPTDASLIYGCGKDGWKANVGCCPLGGSGKYSTSKLSNNGTTVCLYGRQRVTALPYQSISQYMFSQKSFGVKKAAQGLLMVIFPHTKVSVFP